MGDARKYMMRAIELAERAVGRTAPNPMVGCVIVKGGRLIAEGWHEGPGFDHAEIAALKAAGPEAQGATVYVSLEPCNHTGRTGPCSEALIEARVAEVVYALADPNPPAAGGADRLRLAGIKVRGGVCEAEARALNRYWIHAVETKRPYVIAKFAASLDGKIATHTGDSKWITSAASRARTHELRRQVDGIIVGANTVIADDPTLTARSSGEHVRHPLRIALDSTARTSPGAKIYDRAGKGALLATTDAAPKSRLAAFREHGVDILLLKAGENGRPDPADLLADLGGRGLNSIMVEGGGAVLGSFFDAGLVDEVWAFIAPAIIGGSGKSPVGGDGAAVLADAFRLSDVKTEFLEGDILMRGRILNHEEAR